MGVMPGLTYGDHSGTIIGCCPCSFVAVSGVNTPKSATELTVDTLPAQSCSAGIRQERAEMQNL